MERVLANKANYLSAHGYEIIIVTTDQRGRKSFFPFNDSIKCYDLDINYEENNGRSIWNKLSHYPLKEWKHRRRLTKILKTVEADITVSMFCNDISFITKIKDGSRKVLEIHFSKFKKLQYARRGLWRMADVWRSHREEELITRFDRFVVLTEEDKGYWGNLPNIEVIYNARTFATGDCAALVEKNVLAVGRYCSQKGFDMLIDIWHAVHRELPDWQLNIVGDGELRESIQKKIGQYGLQESVTLVRPTEDIGKYYLQSSVVVLTSRYEGLPMVLIEAQAFGLPAVAFTCKCGPRDILTDAEDGYLVDLNNKRRFVVKLIALMRYPSLRQQMGKAAKKNSERFSEDVVMKKWITLFESLKH
jgi:glycosyltransferase involved in cell wall biosynthesis